MGDKPPVRIEIRIEKRPLGYEVRVSFDDGGYIWAKLHAKTRPAAEKRVANAVAHLMVERAKLLEEQATELLTKAHFLRDCAKVKGVL